MYGALKHSGIGLVSELCKATFQLKIIPRLACVNASGPQMAPKGEKHHCKFAYNLEFIYLTLKTLKGISTEFMHCWSTTRPHVADHSFQKCVRHSLCRLRATKHAAAGRRCPPLLEAPGRRNCRATPSNLVLRFPSSIFNLSSP